MVTINNMLVDSFAAEVFKNFIDAVNAVEDGLEEGNRTKYYDAPNFILRPLAYKIVNFLVDCAQA